MILALLFLLAIGEDVRENRPQPQAAPQLTKLPQLLEAPPAQYPPERLARGETAEVPCTVDIDEHGAVTGVAVETKVAPDFDAAAVAAIRSFRFSPAEMDGKPAPVRFRYVYHFVIEKKAVPQPQSETGIVKGEVVEAGNRRPLAGAEVTDDVGAQAVTDGEGRYQIQCSAGERKLTFAAPGFESRDLAIKVAADETVEARRIWLHRTAVGDLQATIPGEKPQDAPTRRTLTHDELVNVPGSLNDPIRAIQNLPGLARAPYLSGALLVRGSAPADTGIYFDGHRIPLLFHFFGGPSVINEELLDRIDFYPGGYGASYGRNLVGAIDVGTRKGDAQGLHGAVALGLYESVAFLEGPLGSKTQFAAAARRSDLDFWLTPLIRSRTANNSDNGVLTILPIYWDYQSRVDHRFENGDQLSLLLFGSDDRGVVAQSGGTRTLPISFALHDAFHRLIGEYKHPISSELTLSLSPALGWTKISFDTSGLGVGAATGSQSQTADLIDLTAELRSEARYRMTSWFELRAGTDLEFHRETYSADISLAAQTRSLGVPILERFTFSRVLPAQFWGEYLEAPMTLGRLQLTPGLRADQVHWRGHSRWSVDPRLWARYALTDDQWVKAYTGLYHQPFSLQQAPQQIDPDLGNPNLGLQWAAQFGVGWEKRFSDVWDVSAEVFYNRRGSLIVPVDPVQLPNGAYYNPRFLNNGIGRAYGLEILIRREFTAQLYGWLAYTLSRSELLNNPGDQWRAYTFDQTHILILVAGWQPRPQWLFGTRFRLVSGNPFAPVDFATFDADSGSYVPTRGQVGGAREPLFLQLDAQVQHTWTWDWWKLALYLDVQNITNHLNQEFHVYDYRYRAQGSVQGIPFLPTLGVKGSF